MQTRRTGASLRPVGDVVHEIEERGLAPVDVVEDEHQRAALGERLDERAHRTERLLGTGRLLNEADDLAQPLRDVLRIIDSVEQGNQPRQIRRHSSLRHRGG